MTVLTEKLLPSVSFGRPPRRIVLRHMIPNSIQPASLS